MALVAVVGLVFGITRHAAADVKYTDSVNWALYTITDIDKTPGYEGTSGPKLLVLSTNPLSDTYSDEKYGDNLKIESAAYKGTWNTNDSNYPGWYKTGGSYPANYQESIYAVHTASGSNTITPHYANRLFAGCIALVDISGVSDWDMSGALGLLQTFVQCQSLENIGALEKWSIGQVTTTQMMFSECLRLQDISALASWDTHSVTNMSSMFAGCENLTSVKALENWQTGAVKNMSLMFGMSIFDNKTSCSSLATLDGLERWDVSEVTLMQSMFDGCRSLGNVTALEGWRPESVKEFSSMFKGCSSLEDISALSNWKTSSATLMFSMFEQCSSLKTVGSLNWDTSKVTKMDDMFRGCTALKTVDGLGTWNVSGATDLSYLFYHDANLERVVIWDWGLEGQSLKTNCDVSSMFSGCSSLKTIYCDGSWDVETGKGGSVFEGCSGALKSQSSGATYENLKNDSSYCNPTTGYFTNSIIPPVDSNASLTFNGASQVSGLEAAQWAGTNYYTFTQAMNESQKGTQYNGTIGSDRLSVSGTHAGTYDVTASVDFVNAVPATLKGKIGFKDAPADSITLEASTTTVHFTIDKAMPTISILDASGSGPAGTLTLDPGGSVTVRLQVMYNGASGDLVAYDSPLGSISPDDFTVTGADGLDASFKAVEGSDDVVELTITAPAGTSGSKSVQINFKGNGDLQAANASQSVEVSEPDPGALKVTKTVSGLPDGVTTSRKFTFSVGITLAGGKVFTGTSNGVSFEDGKASFELGNGGSQLLSGIPAGAKYVVTEEPCAGYSTSSENAEGIIASGETKTASFTNSLKMGSLTITKQVIGGGVEGQSFAITVSPADPTASMRGYSYSIGGGDPVTIGENSVTLMLSGGQTATFLALPAGDYLVSEADYRSYGYSTSYSGGAAAEGGMTASVPYEGSADVVVTNTFSSGALALTKQVTGTDSTRDFTFTLQASTPITGPRPVTCSGGTPSATRPTKIDFTNGAATLTLTGDETATIARLPDGAITISETAVPGYKATVSGDATEAVDGVATAIIASGATKAVTFTNAYTTGSLSITKRVLVGSGGSIPGTSFDFTIQFPNASDFEELEASVIAGTVTKPGSSSSQSVTFKGNPATVSLEDGETLTIPNLPEGLKYRIEETTIGESITAWQSDDANAEISARAISGTIASPATTITCNNILGGNHKLPSVYENANLLVGQEITYTIAWENTSSEAKDVVIYDPICMGFTFKEASGEGSYDSSGELPADVAKPYDYHGVVTWDLGKQAAGQRGSVTVTLEVNESAFTAGSVENAAVISIDNEATVVETPALVVDDPGFLTVAKELAPGTSAEGPFAFKVTFTDINGNPYSRAISYEFEGEGIGSLTPIAPPAEGMTMPDADGSITFTLSAGQSVKFGNLLAKTTFTAQETDSGGLVPSWKADGTTGSSGTIESNATAALVCTNAKPAPGPTPPGPVQPDNPDNPDTPDTPDNPDNPDTPDNPDNPDNPSNPNTPENPSNPDSPGSQPGTPGTGSDSNEHHSTPRNPNALPKTGDDNPLTLPAALMATGIALLVLAVILLRPRRRA